jgi:selenide, water dikinase
LAQVLQPLKGIFPTENYPALLVGLTDPDDAAVYRLNADQAVVSTVDFFPPVVDDAYDFGAIAAANALSDVYAMGGTPLFAINLVAYPDGFGLETLTTILRGGADKVKEAGAVIAGGHTVTDKEPKYGLAVTGILHPERVVHKGGARIGDKLILTKPLGSGVITTALKRDKADPVHVADAVRVMSRLNKRAADIALQFGVHAMTDITGYSLLGHGHEMAHLGHVGFRLKFGALRWQAGALGYAAQDCFPGGMSRNKDYFETWTTFDSSLHDYEQHLLFDPQTSGGLLMAISPDLAHSALVELIAHGEDAALIGEVVAGDGQIYVER